MSAFLGISLFLLIVSVHAGSIVQQTRQLKVRSQKEQPEANDRNEQEAPTREEMLERNAVQNPSQDPMDAALPPALDASVPALPAAQQQMQLQQMQQLQQ